MKQIVHTDSAPTPISPISQATKAGGFVLTSGILGRTPAGEMVQGGMAAEARQALENLRSVLTAAHASLADVMRIEMFVVDLNDMPAFNAVFREYFPSHPPARVCVQVNGLAGGARVELMGTAYVKQV